MALAGAISVHQQRECSAYEQFIGQGDEGHREGCGGAGGGTAGAWGAAAEASRGCGAQSARRPTRLGRFGECRRSAATHCDPVLRTFALSEGSILIDHGPYVTMNRGELRGRSCQAMGFDYGIDASKCTAHSKRNVCTVQPNARVTFYTTLP